MGKLGAPPSDRMGCDGLRPKKEHSSRAKGRGNNWN